MSKKITALCTLPFIFQSCYSVASNSAPVIGADYTQRVSVTLGERWLDESDWEPLDSPFTAGISYAKEDPDAFMGIGWELGFNGSWEDKHVEGIKADAEIYEISGGLRHTFETGSRVRPYIGAGLAYLDVELDIDDLDFNEDDDSFAGYAHAGVIVDVSETLFLGVDYRKTFFSDIELGNLEGDADYDQLSVVIGFGF